MTYGTAARTAETYDSGQESRISVDDLAQWAESGINIAAKLTQVQRDQLGQLVLKEYQIDKASRAPKETAWKDAVDLAKQVVETKNYPWPGASNVKFPALTIASVQFAARSYPAIVKGPEIVKGRIVGSDKGVQKQGQGGLVFVLPNGQEAEMGPQQLQEARQRQIEVKPAWAIPPGFKQAKADRIAEHMSYQLSEDMEEWEEDTDKLLHALPVYGSAFRKTWFDADLQRPHSRLILPENLVVNFKAESLERAARITESISLYPSEITERMRQGIFVTEDLKLTQGDDKDEPVEFLEQHRTYDLDDDGYPEPYICTVHKDSGKVVRIMARFDPDGIIQAQDNGEIVKIEPIHYYTKYAFVPSPDGEFYDLGFADLLGPLNRSINTTINQLLDAGHLQNTGGGFISSDLEIKAGNQRFRPGEWKRIEAIQGNIQNSVLPLPVPQPSTVLFQLLGLLIDAAHDVASTKDVLSGDMPMNQPATTTLAVIEQGLKAFTAIHKRVYRSLKAELKKLRRLNRMYLEPQHYQMILDDPRATAKDYADGQYDVVPVADPETVTDMQRLARAEAVLQLAGNSPWIDGREANERYLRALGEETEGLLLDQLPPNPAMLAQADQMELEKRNTEIKAADTENKIALSRIEAAERLSKIILNIAQAEAAEAGTQIDAYEAEARALASQVNGPQPA